MEMSPDFPLQECTLKQVILTHSKQDTCDISE